MGNTNSNNSKYNNIDMVDMIAANYIITSNLKNVDMLSRPGEEYKRYCNNFLLVSSEMLNNLSNLDISTLNNRTNETNIITKSELNTETNTFNNEEKTKICKKISIFYMKIAHLYAAIVSILDPIIKIKDGQNNTREERLLNYTKTGRKLPLNYELVDLKISLCNRRVRSLGVNNIDRLNDNKIFSIKPINSSPCYVNLLSDNKEVKILSDEFGIVELERLYYVENSDGSLSIPAVDHEKYEPYKKTLFELYELFSNDANFSKMDDSKKMEYLQSRGVTSFGRIQLNDYRNLPQCQDEKQQEIIKTSVNADNEVEKKATIDYLNHVKSMEEENTKSINKILEQLNQIFKVTDDENKRAIINRNLKEDELDNIIMNTREMIKNLFIECETKYLEGLEKYKNIKMAIQQKKNTNSKTIPKIVQ